MIHEIDVIVRFLSRLPIWSGVIAPIAARSQPRSRRHRTRIVFRSHTDRLDYPRALLLPLRSPNNHPDLHSTEKEDTKMMMIIERHTRAKCLMATVIMINDKAIASSAVCTSLSAQHMAWAHTVARQLGRLIPLASPTKRAAGSRSPSAARHADAGGSLASCSIRLDSTP